MRCVVFSNNKKKLAELEDLLSDLDLDVVSYRDIVDHAIHVVEDGLTFEANAIKKVRAISFLKDDILLADDSGLEVSILNGKPGVFSGRYGGESLTDNQRCLHLLKQIEQETNRDARFVCCIALSCPKQSMQTMTGVVDGQLSFDISGYSGFGYDPIFIPNGHNQTFSELGYEIKRGLSHRFKALTQAKEYIKDFLAKK